MGIYLLARLGHGFLVVLAITTFVFFIVQQTGDPAGLLISPIATPEEVIALRRHLGLDENIFVQYGRFLQNAFVGDFGQSFRQQQPALQLVLERFPATLELALAATLISVGVGIPLGILAAVKHNSAIDRAVSLFSLLGQAIPVFWLGLMLLLIFGVQLQLLPLSGRGSWRHLILPAIALGGYSMARITRVTRSSLLEALNQDYVRTARAKGLSGVGVVFKHAFRNASIPIVTIVALDVGAVLSGSIITETIFSWPGLGRLLIQAVQYRDFPVIIAGVFFFSVLIVLINILVDLVYALLDPRITYH